MRSASILFRTVIWVWMAGACANRHVPDPPSVVSGEPHTSWWLGAGTAQNPEQQRICQSSPRTSCVISVTGQQRQVFATLHLSYHPAATDTTYAGFIRIGFFEGSPESHDLKVNATVKARDSQANQSITDIVSSRPGTYPVDLSIVATSTPSGKTQNIRDEFNVMIK